jgi:hypothetical protein
MVAAAVMAAPVAAASVVAAEVMAGWEVPEAPLDKEDPEPTPDRQRLQVRLSHCPGKPPVEDAQEPFMKIRLTWSAGAASKPAVVATADLEVAAEAEDAAPVVAKPASAALAEMLVSAAVAEPVATAEISQ